VLHATRIIHTVAAVLTLISPAVQAFDNSCNKDHSLGWCLLDFGGRSNGARDVPEAKANELIAKAVAAMPAVDAGASGAQISQATATAAAAPLPPSTKDGAFVAIAAMDYAKWTMPPPGVSSTFNGSMSLLGFLLSGPKAGEQNQTFVILPESEVLDGDPRTTVENVIVQSMLRYLEADHHEVIDREMNPPLGARYTKRSYRATGGKCNAIVGACDFTSPIFSCSNCSSGKPDVIENAPAWAGGGRVYVWKSAHVSFREKEEDGKPTLLSGKLPDFYGTLPNWFYYYRPGAISLLVHGGQTEALIK
jgi:hypothetical protein